MAKKTTGRFDTREELVDRVVRYDMAGEMSMDAIGKSCGVSQGTVKKILDGDEGKALREKLAQEIADEGMKKVNDLVDNPPEIAPERHNIDTYTEDGKTYQIDLMSHSPEFQKFELAKRIARTLAASTLVPDAYMGRPNDCFVAINMGAELGMEPFQAIQSIAVIDGKPCLYGDGLIGVVRASPKCLWIEETLSEDGKTATCRTQRDGDPNPIEATYSMTDAVQAGIDQKFNWKKHPKRMLQMRARAYCLRDAYPDLLKGLGVVEERQDYEDTPPPITNFKLPEKPQDALESQAQEIFGSGASVEAETVTLAMVERAMHQSDSMEELLKAGDLAKQLTNEQDRGTARITYQKMRNALLETS